MTNVFGGYGGRTAALSNFATKAELAQKATRASGAAFGNIASLTSDGDLSDSGIAGGALTTRVYTDSRDALRVRKAGDDMSGELNMRGGRITNLGQPEHGSDAANRRFVAQQDQGVINAALQLFLARDGSSKPTADIDFGGHALRNLAGPASSDDAATMGYVDNAAISIAHMLQHKAISRDGSNAPTAAISWGGQRLTSLAGPADPQDAATKEYVDKSAGALRYYFRLHMRRPAAAFGGVDVGTFFIPNNGRFPADVRQIFITLTAVGAPNTVFLDGTKVDENYLLLKIGVKMKKGRPLNISFNAVVELTLAESIAERGVANQD